MVHWDVELLLQQELLSTTPTTFATDLPAGGTAQGKVTGCEVGIGAMDEDITYYGMRSVTKAEIKKGNYFQFNT